LTFALLNTELVFNITRRKGLSFRQVRKNFILIQNLYFTSTLNAFYPAIARLVSDPNHLLDR